MENDNDYFFQKLQGADTVELNPNHLLTLLKVIREKSVTRAAELMNLGQPAISARLRQLNLAVGEPLYRRKGHEVVLTPAGEGLMVYAVALEENMKKAEGYIRRLKGLSAGTLRIGATVTASNYYIPLSLVEFQKKFPGIRISVETAPTHELFRRMTELDLGFVEDPIEEDIPETFQVKKWWKDKIVLIYWKDHPMSEKWQNGVMLEELVDYPIIWREPESGVRKTVEKAIEKKGLRFKLCFEVSGADAVKEAVRAKMGIGFVARRVLEHGNSDLLYCEIDPPRGIEWWINIIEPIDKMKSRATQALVDLCMQMSHKLMDKKVKSEHLKENDMLGNIA
ncbi:LysR family transcriptional regulator [Candidatus Methylacidiphilum infernorum]|uniref:Transcriptional regulator, LysR/CysB family n=1 Tax=Methylacidiphilum infernorum (isolate V4) TaxID=481448 RepID=B3DYL9_METI4|nr:LysR family transcriptional regulator [Candidatus Methylacidiphilum infernorum]ACD84067.1 Transcriptional regulator, LysR/CysB family [Methylacidiphilum infernorum V4]